MGAREQENATESGDSVASLRVLCGERDPKAKGAKGLLVPAQREGNTSPPTTSERGGLAPEGAKKGAKRRDPSPLNVAALGESYATKFWSRVDQVEGSCWLWKNARNGDGYGVAMCGRLASGNPRLALTHRIAFELAKGPVPDGMELDHLCKNRLCCNPQHLEAVTHRTNVIRSDSPRLVGERNRARAAARKAVSA